MKILNEYRIVFIGDSITDNERGRPIGDGFGLGFVGYVRQVDTLLKVIYPDMLFDVVNMGNVGDTTRELLARWQTDVLDQKPDVVCVLVGTNDCWRIVDCPATKRLQVMPEEYEKNLREMIARTKGKARDMIFMTPYLLEKNDDDSLKKLMIRYADIVKKVCKENDFLCIDLQKYFDEFMKYRYGGQISWDRVHPSWIGGMIIAKAFLEGIDSDRHFLNLK